MDQILQLKLMRLGFLEPLNNKGIDMAFNQQDQGDLDKLNTEVFTDPTGMNYASIPVEKSKELVRFMNDPVNNITGTPSDVTFTHDVLMETWEPKSTMNEGIPWIEALLRETGDISHYEAKYRTFASAASITNLDGKLAMRSRPAEDVLFGVDTVITDDDWYAARDNGNIIP